MSWKALLANTYCKHLPIFNIRVQFRVPEILLIVEILKYGGIQSRLSLSNWHSHSRKSFHPGQRYVVTWDMFSAHVYYLSKGQDRVSNIQVSGVPWSFAPLHSFFLSSFFCYAHFLFCSIEFSPGSSPHSSSSSPGAFLAFSTTYLSTLFFRIL